MRTRKADKFLYKNYLKKAEECFSAMNSEFLKGNFNACVVNAIHCAISASDALTVFFNGVRHAGEDHKEAIGLLKNLKLDNLNSKISQLLSLLNIKSGAEYEEKLMSRSDALTAMLNAERFFKWVKGILK